MQRLSLQDSEKYSDNGVEEMKEYIVSEGSITLLERIAGYEIIIAVSIAVLGWIITHWFNRKAQKEQLINSIKKEARLHIIHSLREYQKWLIGIKTLDCFTVTFEFTRDKTDKNKELIKGVTEQVKRGFNELNFEESILWKHRLEEYEILFPKTINLRRELIDRDRYIYDKQVKIIKQLTTNDSNKQYDAINEIGNKEFNKFILDQGYLVEDLLVYLQNYCLGELINKKLYLREIIGDRYPRIIEGRNGDLEISYNT